MRAKRRKKQNRQSIKINPPKVIIIAFLVLTAAIFSFAFLMLRNTQNYFTIASTDQSGDINVDYVDLTGGQIYSIKIPKDTEVSLALQRGSLRASSVEKLVATENLPGQFIADTVMKTFYFPVDYWRHGMSSDIPLVLMVRQKLMSLGRREKETINLADTTFLVEQKLMDGQDGYTVRDAMPLLLQSIFADPAFSKNYTAVQIVNKTGQYPYHLHDVIKILEVMGVKVAPISEGEKDEAIDCVATSLDKTALSRVASIFGCSTKYAEPASFDVEIVLGERFYKRFGN